MVPLLFLNSSIHAAVFPLGTTLILTSPSLTTTFPLPNTLCNAIFFPTLMSPPTAVSIYASTPSTVYSCSSSHGNGKMYSRCSGSVWCSLKALTKSDCECAGYSSNTGKERGDEGSAGLDNAIDASSRSGASSVVVRTVMLRALRARASVARSEAAFSSRAIRAFSTLAM